MAGCEPDPRAQLCRGREPGHVTDLRHEHRGADWTDPIDGLHRPIASVVAKVFVDLSLECRDLTVVGDDQLSQRSDAPSEWCTEFELIELTRPGGPEDVGDGG